MFIIRNKNKHWTISGYTLLYISVNEEIAIFFDKLINFIYQLSSV